MGERKVLNKYIPADFDPRLVPRGSKPKDDVVSVRMMLPFSIQCTTCSSFMYRGKKFNSKKENCKGKAGKYLGIQRFRFYIKCSVCSRPITFLTDPQNTDYEMESGATRNYEVYKDKTKIEDKMEEDKHKQEELDPLKALEGRVLESQREMADLDNLEDIKAMNLRHLQLMGPKKGIGNGGGGGMTNAVSAVFGNHTTNERHKHHQQQEQEEEVNDNGLTAAEEEMVQQMQFGRKKHKQPRNSNANNIISRLDDADELELEKKRQYQQHLMEQQFLDKEKKAEEAIMNRQLKSSSSSMPMGIVKKRRKLAIAVVPTLAAATAPAPQTAAPAETPIAPIAKLSGLGGLLGAYGSSSSSEDST
jgi:hypothetical protein